MGTIFRRGNRWGINFTDPNGKQVRQMVSPYKETAERVLKKMEMNIIEGRYLDKRKTETVLFEDFVEEFIVSHVRLQCKRPKNREGLVRTVAVFFKGKAMHNIDTRMIRQYLSQKLDDFQSSTVNRHLTLLRCMFNRALEWKIIDGDNPTKGIKKLPEDNERCRWLSDKEQAFLLSHCHGMTRVIVMAALQTGLRWNEIMNVQWSQRPKCSYVDFDNNTIVLHSLHSKVNKARFIPLSYALKCELMELRKHSNSEYVFSNPRTGKPFNNIRKSFQKAVKQAGLRDLRFHDLRHVFASNLVSKGVDLYVVQQLLGHSTPRMTQRYAHLRPGHFKAAIDEIDLHKQKI